MPSISKWDLSLPTEGDRLTRRNQISAFYDAGDWKSTYAEARAMLATYPWSVDAHVTEAALLGDFAETFTGPDRDRRKAAAVRKLRYWVRTPPVNLLPCRRLETSDPTGSLSLHARGAPGSLFGRRRCRFLCD